MLALPSTSEKPDMVVLGKALGGGMLPIAAVLADARFDIAPDLALGHYTHEKNPLTTRTALTCLKIILRDQLPARAATLEQIVRARVAELASSHPAIRSVRGKGLLLAIERHRHALADVSEDRLLQTLLDHGISTTTKGNESLGFSPPMTVSEMDLQWALTAMATALQSFQ